ncbi:MAG: CDP-diacylglycerol--glycerol-3-phosphate 3-phosphatidyltransferase [Firmicutes bacterium]|nr:CDP-diacylglycerol--glycerol-3-phosphate 3-phosphatidyltransferase [Bacillota bacterium]
MNIPTKITVARIALIPIFVAVFFLDDVIPYNRLIAAIIFAVAALTDWVDGFLARRLNQITDLGKFLDPIADKFLVMSALIAIVASPIEFQVTIAVFTIIILSRELAISTFRIIAASKNLTLAADKLGKVKTVLQMLALLVLIPMVDIVAFIPESAEAIEVFGIILLGGATAMTLISGISYLVKNRHVLNTAEKEVQNNDNNNNDDNA